MERIDRQEVTWRELAALTDGLMNDHSSHTFASVMGWAYVPTPAEVQFYNELDVRIAMRRGKNQPTQPPTKRPWEQRIAQPSSVRRDPESGERRKLLNDRLGLVDEEVL